MVGITELISELMPVLKNIIAMNPNNIQELESNVREIATEIGNKIIKLKLESIDKELSSCREKKNICKCATAAGVDRRKRGRQILTTFGKIDMERTMSQCRECGQTRFDLDEAMGLEPYTRVSPMLKRLSALCAASWSYQMARDVLCELLGIEDVISPEQIEKLSKATAKDIEKREEIEQENLKLDYRESLPSRVYIDVDGGMVNSWDEAERMEGKAVVIWSKKVKVKSRKEIVDKFYGATFNSYEQLIGRINYELWTRCGFARSKVEMVLRGDGANWIRQMKKDYFGRALYILYIGLVSSGKEDK